MTFASSPQSFPRRFRAAALPAALLLAGALQMPAVHASDQPGPSKRVAVLGVPPFPTELSLLREVEDSAKFRAQVANAMEAYLEARDQKVDPYLERQATPDATAALARCDAALERMIEAGFAAWQQALEEYVAEGGSQAEVEAYQETAREGFTAWLEETIVKSVVTMATAMDEADHAGT